MQQGFQGEFLWAGTTDKTAWLAVPAALAVIRALGPGKQAAYSKKLLAAAVPLLQDAFGTSNTLGASPTQNLPRQRTSLFLGAFDALFLHIERTVGGCTNEQGRVPWPTPWMRKFALELVLLECLCCASLSVSTRSFVGCGTSAAGPSGAAWSVDSIIVHTRQMPRNTGTSPAGHHTRPRGGRSLPWQPERRARNVCGFRVKGGIWARAGCDKYPVLTDLSLGRVQHIPRDTNNRA